MAEPSVSHPGHRRDRAAAVEALGAELVAGDLEDRDSGQHTSRVKGHWAWTSPYCAAKSGIQDRVREAGFAHWTTEIATILSGHLKTTVTAPDMAEDEAVTAGMPDMGFGQSHLNESPSPRSRSSRGTGCR